MLNFHQWCKTPSSAFRKKNSATTPNFLYVFGGAYSDLQLCFVQLKTVAPSARYSTFKYPVTLKPGLRVTQGHRELYQWIRHPRLPMNVPYIVTIVLSRTVSEISAISVQNRQSFLPPCIYSPDEGVPLEFGIGVRGPKCLNDGATRWSKKF